MLTAADLHDAFAELGALVRAEGKVIDLAVYGGSALMLVSNFRVATRDVDAVAAEDQGLVERLAGAIAARRNWPADWLNDGVRTYLSPAVDGMRQHHALFRAYPSEPKPGLWVFVPSAEYILAMKLMAMRIDPAAGTADFWDILNLLDIVGLKAEEVVSFAAAFYPEARISARLQLGIRELLRARDELTKGGPGEPPTYLGRARPSP